MFKKILLAAICTFYLCGSAVAAEKTIVFASDATWPPMEFLNDQKQIVGYSADYLVAIGKEAGFTPVIKNTAWD